MTPAAALARLREIAAEQRRLSEESARLLAAIAGHATEPPAETWLNSKEAMRLARVNSLSTLYRWARTHGIGHRSASGSWLFSDRSLRRFLDRGEFGEANGEFGEGPPLPSSANGDHHPDRRQQQT